MQKLLYSFSHYSEEFIIVILVIPHIHNNVEKYVISMDLYLKKRYWSSSEFESVTGG